nr:CRISPR-associated protein Cas4 [uncultured Porphyromonas sp.]
MYTEDEMFPLSGIQHYAFCPRQWYLIHVEQLWEENHLTAEGHLLHEKVHQPEESGRRGDAITLRSVPLASPSLGLYGYSDAVELHPASESEGAHFHHPKYPGEWEAMPIEYKRGRPKRTNADKLQLCAEAICLEEAYGIHIPRGYLFYGETKHREEVAFTAELRSDTYDASEQMHKLLATKSPVRADYAPRCRSCSLIDLCIPKISQLTPVSLYLRQYKLFD